MKASAARAGGQEQAHVSSPGPQRAFTGEGQNQQAKSKEQIDTVCSQDCPGSLPEESSGTCLWAGTEEGDLSWWAVKLGRARTLTKTDLGVISFHSHGCLTLSQLLNLD